MNLPQAALSQGGLFVCAKRPENERSESLPVAAAPLSRAAFSAASLWIPRGRRLQAALPLSAGSSLCRPKATLLHGGARPARESDSCMAAPLSQNY